MLGRANLWCRIVLPFIFAIANFELYATPQHQQLLEKADDIRSSDRSKFKEILASLNLSANALNQDQKYYLKYLNAYDAAFSGRLDTATRLCKEIIASPNSSEELKFRSNLTLLNSLSVSKNWSEGMAYLSKNIAMLPSIDDSKLKQLGHLAPILTYNLYGQFDTAIKYSKGLDGIVFNKRNACFKDSLIIEAKSKQGLITRLDTVSQSAINSCLAANELAAANFIRTYISQSMIENGDIKSALSLLLNHLAEIKSSGYRRMIIEVYSTLANAYYLLNDFENAVKYAQLVTGNNLGLQTTEPTTQALYVLYKVAESRDQTELAYDFYKKYIDSHFTHQDELSAKALAYELASHKALQQESEIALLNNQNQLLKAEQSLASAEAENTKLLASLLSVIIAILVYFAYRSWQTQKRLKELAEFDALTGIYNRGHFTHVAKSAVRYCENSDQALSIIMFDLDWFKSINDNFGHAAGDWALQATANAIKEISRNNDIFARVGGEEFCLVLTGCGAQQAMSIAEECRKSLEGIDSSDSGFQFNISASFGVTDAKRSSYHLEKLLADADAAAYQSKHDGRNRVTMYRNELEIG